MRNIPRRDALQGRAGNHISCAACGKRLCPKQGSRRMRFCDAACRQSAFRAKKWASRYEGPEPLRSVQNKGVGSIACNGNFAVRTSRIFGPAKVIVRELDHQRRTARRARRRPDRSNRSRGPGAPPARSHQYRTPASLPPTTPRTAAECRQHRQGEHAGLKTWRYDPPNAASA
jgi:hypothetical protein